MIVRHLRLLAVVGTLVSALPAVGAWAFIAFQRHYYPSNSIVPIYFEVAVWSVLALYLAMVAGFNSLKLWCKD